MATLDDVLNGGTSDETASNQAIDNAVGSNTGEAGDATAPAGEGQGAAEPATGAPPASEDGKLVPLSALQEERKGRQDWKEKAIRFEEELKHMREQGKQTQEQQQQQPVEMDAQTALINERFNTSEMLLRDKHDDVDEKLAVFQAEAAKNPALQAQLLQQKHPYAWMYQQAVKMQALSEIGDDPAAYQQSLREKIMAELQASNGQQANQTQAAAPAPVLPKSLATTRSVGTRTAATWTGPTALDDILKSPR